MSTKLALDALKRSNGYLEFRKRANTIISRGSYNTACVVLEEMTPIFSELVAALEAEAVQVEPVAYFLVSLTDNDGTKHYEQVASEYVNDPDVFPLFATPQQAAPAVTINTELEAELKNIADANRFDKTKFEDATDFINWAQSRARFALTKANQS